MKKVLIVASLMFGLSSFGQSVSVEDWNNDNVLEYVKKSDDGTKIEEGHIVNGKHHGTWKSYYSDGTIRVVAKFIEGKRNGLWEFYNTEGSLTHEVVYQDNKRISSSETRYY